MNSDPRKRFGVRHVQDQSIGNWKVERGKQHPRKNTGRMPLDLDLYILAQGDRSGQEGTG
jgi:hypothetical protein